MLIPRARHEVLKLVMSSQQSQNQKLFICHHKNDKEHQQMLTFKNQGTSRSLTVSAWKLLAFIFFLWPAAHKHTVYPVVSKALLPNSTNTSILFHLFYIVCDFLWCLPVRQSRWISVPYPAACRLRPCPTVLGVKRWQVQSVKDSAQAPHLWIMFLFSHQVWPQCILLWDEGVVFSVRHD